MNRFLSALIFALFATVANASPPTIKVNDFLNSIGTNTQINQGQSEAGLEVVLRYLGVRVIREYIGTSTSQLITLHNATGVKVNSFSGAADPLSRFTTNGGILANAGALLSFEGPNEPNNFGVTYQGVSCAKPGTVLSWDCVAKFQKDLYAAIKADPVVGGYPVFGASESGAEADNQGLQWNQIPSGAGVLQADGTKYSDYVNDHNYVQGPGLIDNGAFKNAALTPSAGVDGFYIEHILTWKGSFAGYTTAQAPSVPRVTTETGWSSGGSGATDDQIGRIMLNVFLDQFQAGVKYTFQFQAVDNSTALQGYYVNMTTPRLSADYLHRFTTFLADTSSAFTCGQLSWTMNNPAPTTHAMMLEKSTGPLDLVVWGEKVSGSVSQLIDLCHSFPNVKIYDPVLDTTTNLTNVSTVTLTLTDHPLIVEFGP